MDKQQAPIAQYTVLLIYSISCDKPSWKRMYMNNRVTLLYSRNQHIVNQLYFKKILKA